MNPPHRRPGLKGPAPRSAGARGLDAGDGEAPPFDIEVFYDGGCPLCTREMHLLRRLDRRGRIRCVDIAADGFDAGRVGVTWEALMDRIHGRLSDGTLVEGVEVFRRLYAAVGFSRTVALTRLPGIAQALDLAYRLFARNRLRLTGRCVEGACELHPGRAMASAREPPAVVR
jgi:predicted DCC family thiol-disulfide oxidoreductase YuxK